MVVFFFHEKYGNLSSILICLTHCSYLLFHSMIMSEFPGPISEFPGVSIDRFSSENLKSKVYFLSHCHTDHMVALVSLSSSKGQNKSKTKNLLS